MMKVYTVLLALMVIGSVGFGCQWPQWRGPSFDGSSDATGLVGSWSAEKNTKWVSDLPGSGACTPVICKERVFVSSTDSESDNLLGLCFDASSGKELWRRKVTTASRRIARAGDMAAPSASTDGERVYFAFENAVIAAYDYDGDLQWKRTLEDEYGSVHIKFGYSSTPLLYDGRMYVLVLRHPEQNRGDFPKPLDSFILAIDPVTGKNIFKQTRQFDVLEETYESYVSAIPFEHDGQKEILINAAEYLTGHDPATGKELWRYRYTKKSIRWGRNIASVVTGNGMIFGARERGEGFYAVKGGATGVVKEKDLAWTFDGPSPDVCTPLFYRDKLYVLDGKVKKHITCLSPETGKIIWQGDLGGSTPWRASLTAGDGKIYCINEKGLVVVIDASADDYREICRVDLDARKCLGSIAIANQNLFIRTGSKLYCIGR